MRRAAGKGVANFASGVRVVSRAVRRDLRGWLAMQLEPELSGGGPTPGPRLAYGQVQDRRMVTGKWNDIGDGVRRRSWRNLNASLLLVRLPW
jgi:hypothetical protein